MSKSKIIALTGLIITVFLLASFTQAMAATMKFRIVCFHTQVETVEVPDVEGHKIYAGGSTGLASLETGEVAVATLKWVADYIKGAGRVPLNYYRLTFEDGSTIDIKFESTTRPDQKGKGSLLKSTSLVITQGSGRYAGIKGKGTLTGRRVAPIGVKAQLYLDVTLTYTLP
jgi:hypothetical protein